MTRAPSITVHVPAPLRDRCAGASELAFPAAHVRGVLDEIECRHPELHRSICDETGTVRRHINLFVNNDHMRDRHPFEMCMTRSSPSAPIALCASSRSSFSCPSLF